VPHWTIEKSTELPEESAERAERTAVGSTALGAAKREEEFMLLLLRRRRAADNAL